TLEGQKRLKKILPGADYTKKWDGNWYLVSFDIPEKLRGTRNILRAVLRRLGFGRVQKSVWISPFNLLGDIEKTVDDLDIASYVILSISDKVGREESRTLAGRIWHISAFQKEYLEFIQKCKTGKMSRAQRFFGYHSIADRDPSLPKELLPRDWLGDEEKNLLNPKNP
ncbi:MAG: PaaX family transcriptional regulator C-terminal domain-containing protein, partial [bacterium]|nr:PaaX family transcriptional regulator C-terminal domain-containing protein [bacterium]